MPFLRQICVRFGTTLEMQADDKMTINRERETPPHTTREPLLLMIIADIGRAKASITLWGQRASSAHPRQCRPRRARNASRRIVEEGSIRPLRAAARAGTPRRAQESLDD